MRVAALTRVGSGFLLESLRRFGRKVAVAVLVALLMPMLTSVAWSQPSTQPPGSGGIKPICPSPGVCFANKAAKDTWANQNNCKFLEDVCEKTPASQDNKGAKPEDAGFWSGLWSDVAGAIQYGYEFGKGLFSGLVSQITDIIDLITDPLEVAKGLAALGKAFYDDPKGTLIALGELLGQEAVDTIAKATECGAYDLGKVIGSYVSPATALKLASKLSKFTGKIADAVKAVKVDLGCASFAAGTWVHTAKGLTAIESLNRGDRVAARDEARWLDADQRVTDTFGRIAPSYRELQTERELFQITDEHPLWVQGKGWTAAKEVEAGDVLASLSGDVLVSSNAAVPRTLRVYNFSVANTPNYFVGESGLWAHNAKKGVCDLPTASATSFEGQINKPGMFGSLGERQAFIKVKLTEVAKGKGWTKEGALTKKNNREIYKDTDGNFWAFDTQHGRFEKLNNKGKHQGEFDIDGKFIVDSIDTKGGHDIII